MLIDVLVCKADGTQVVESREVPEDYFQQPPGEEAPAGDSGEMWNELAEALDEGVESL